MKESYERASKVLICLGDDTDGTAEQALDLISKAAVEAEKESGCYLPTPAQIVFESLSAEQLFERRFPATND